MEDKSLPGLDIFYKHLFAWRLFWVVSISFLNFLLFYKFGPPIRDLVTDLFYANQTIFIVLGTLALLIVIGLIHFFIRPAAQLKKQGLHNQPSWVFYFYWGFVNGLILWSAVALIAHPTEFWLSGYCWIGLVLALITMLLKKLNEHLCQSPDLTFRNFAAGAVGPKDDKLTFEPSAKNAASGLKKLNNYVNVVGIYGGLGFGKSSYARMIIENFDPIKTLYTYISLTETNEAKDFSRLFAERWIETLTERYPKLDVASYLPFMQSILRESGNGLLSDLLKILSLFNWGLIKTRAVAYDQFYGDKKVFTSKIVGRIFGNIPEIKELLWIIMVDEIERGQLDEIYRLVEIVERFKNEGRSGLPIKLIFIFCISEPEFRKHLQTFESVDSRVRPLQTFFYDDPKSVVQRIFLPPVEPLIRYKYVDDLLTNIAKSEGVDTPTEIYPHTFSHPNISFMGKHSDAMGYVVGVLAEQSPRVVARVSTALEFFYGSFRDRSGGQKVNAIRFSDVTMLEFIKIQHPFLIEFFMKTIHLLIAQTEKDNLGGYLIKKELEEKKTGLIGWVESIIGRTLSDEEKINTEKYIGLVMHYYLDFLQRSYDTKNKIQYSGTTSYPEIMHDYLSLVSESVETGYRKYSRIYQQHQSDKSNKTLSTLNNKDLVGYARFVHEMWDVSEDLNIRIMDELGKRLVNGKIVLQPMNVGDTEYDEAIYQFVFQILSVIEKDKSGEKADEGLKSVLKILKKILSSSSVNIGAKYIVLNSLANNERGSGSSIHQRLEAAFDKLLKYFDQDVKNAIKSVFEDLQARYFLGKKIIYKYEENFFYVLYQSWSGSKEATNEINKIRNAARRGLKQHPGAIKLYWSKYPLKEGWKNLDDVLKGDPFFSGSEVNNGLYMPLETLISITKQSHVDDKEVKAKLAFWAGIANDPRLEKSFELKDDLSTLRAVVVKRGLLS
ncbi:MAG: hypothetical protein UY23_C0001G0052 [Candidatus Jorgensenbacteria bacterium GW2011_GWA1_48_11]|uniref:Uncharacterized protein n=1 Tax=Candidatus Jorgensenbacteria bacterium GW2011_GWA1_48_11 TaxID=1618660 RepID=A0A0G1UBA1_9BACT|nr:MAG: hypothetical protein UY23_C0001G0052 [Candidatus Jorgensenbacteria bacterium GW2011_GWA1_48_11]KKW11940.1 MAG: hypothetical protein UY51_C0005G0182 [Candidatus Jorgensenbacteria bacterium GW2011_GWB1_49_9]